MEAQQIQQLVEQGLTGSSVHVEGGSGKYHLSAVSDAFEGLNVVKRNQLIYGMLNEHIASGAIHAITMDLKTTTETDSGS